MTNRKRKGTKRTEAATDDDGGLMSKPEVKSSRSTVTAAMTTRSRKRTEATTDGDGGLKSKPGRSAIPAAMTNQKKKRTEAAIDDDSDLKSKPGRSAVTAATTNRKRKRTDATTDSDGGLKSKPGGSAIPAAMTNRKKKRKEAAIDDLESKPVSRKSQTRQKKKPKQTGDTESGSVLGDNRIEDVRWLCSLSESELDLLIFLKMMVSRRAKKIDPTFADNKIDLRARRARKIVPPLADKIDLKALRDLSFTMMKKLKDELKKDDGESAEYWEKIAESNLSQVDVKGSFSSMTSEELWPVIYREKAKAGRKKKLDK